MNITVLEELKAYIDPLTPDEHEALERSLLAEGCRDALVLWGDILVDGHNRHAICTQHGIPFETKQHPHFRSMEDVHLWMINQHLGRRSVSDYQRGVLALRKKALLEARKQAAVQAIDQATAPAASVPDDDAAGAQTAGAAIPVAVAADTLAPWEEAEPLKSREAIARAARISSATVAQIEKIQQTAVPELVAAVKAGDISISAAAVVATLPQDEQQTAVAGGSKQLKEVARQVREAKSGSRTPKTPTAEQLAERQAQAGQDQDALLRELTEPRPDESPEAFIARLQHTVRELWLERARLTAAS
jgi:lipoprotein-anchoring transpeptidase ErfK/SrfK